MVQTIEGTEIIRRVYNVELVIVRDPFSEKIDGLSIFSIIREEA
jgi:hypothetical protein